jgi:hypothetical protein
MITFSCALGADDFNDDFDNQSPLQVVHRSQEM